MEKTQTYRTLRSQLAKLIHEDETQEGGSFMEKKDEAESNWRQFMKGTLALAHAARTLYDTMTDEEKAEIDRINQPRPSKDDTARLVHNMLEVYLVNEDWQDWEGL